MLKLMRRFLIWLGFVKPSMPPPPNITANPPPTDPPRNAD